MVVIVDHATPLKEKSQREAIFQVQWPVEASSRRSFAGVRPSCHLYVGQVSRFYITRISNSLPCLAITDLYIHDCIPNSLSSTAHMSIDSQAASDLRHRASCDVRVTACVGRESMSVLSFIPGLKRKWKIKRLGFDDLMGCAALLMGWRLFCLKMWVVARNWGAVFFFFFFSFSFLERAHAASHST